MWINNWQQMYICEDMRKEPQWAEYEEIIEEEQDISEEEALEQDLRSLKAYLTRTFKNIPEDVEDACEWAVRLHHRGKIEDLELLGILWLKGEVTNPFDGFENAGFNINNLYNDYSLLC